MEINIKKVAEELTKWQFTIVLLAIFDVVMFISWLVLAWMLIGW